MQPPKRVTETERKTGEAMSRAAPNAAIGPTHEKNKLHD